jgi:hypothetical protein
MMLLPILALVLSLPQVVGYAAWRLSGRGGVPEWLAGTVAAYTAMWYPIFGSVLREPPPSLNADQGHFRPAFALGTLLVGLSYQLVVGGVLATAATRKHRQAGRAASQLTTRSSAQ